MSAFKQILLVPLVGVPLYVFCDPPVKAAVIINAVELNGGVVFDYAGNVNTTDIYYAGQGGRSGGGTINPSSGVFLAFDGYASQYLDPYFPVTFGTGGSSGSIGSVSGDKFGISLLITARYIWLPENYISGNPISGSMAFANSSFSSLGLTQGTYVTSLPHDTITMNIGAAPVPAPLPLLGLGAATAFSRQLKQRIALRRKREVVGESA